MRCPSCRHDNRSDRRFCTQCGTKLAVGCPSCGAPIEGGEKFCGGCGAAPAIVGVVTRRNVNPGDHVLVGQGMMALRSVTEIWVDANFTETQLA